MGDQKIFFFNKKIQRSNSGTSAFRNEAGDANVPASRARSFSEAPRQVRSASIIALEELVQCGICLDKLADPRMLSCQHTFCLSCLQAHVLATAGRKMGKKHTPPSQDEMVTIVSNTENNEIRCPTCQVTVNVGRGIEGLQQLPHNVYIDSLLKFFAGANSPIQQTPVPSLPQGRCVKCQTIGEFKEDYCAHCKQMFCKVCWTEHLAMLKTNLSTLADHLMESETRLDHRVEDFQQRCDKLGVNIKKVAKEKLSEIQALEENGLKQLDEMKTMEEQAAKALRERVQSIKKEIEQLTFESIHNDKQKINTFMNFHRGTSKILNEISQMGEVRLMFDPKTFTVKRTGDFNAKESMDDLVGDVVDGSAIKNPLESMETMKVYYRTKTFSPKLVWTKCPRPAGVGIAPWAPNLLYIAATDRKVVLIMDRNLCKVIGKLAAPEMLCPHSVCFWEKLSEIYVSDKWRHCIHVFSSEGDYLRTMCVLGSGVGELRSPEGIAITQRNELVVCDVGNDRVVILDPMDGKQISTLGMIDKRTTELQAPTGVAVHGDKVVVADNGNYRIKVFSDVGQKLLEFGSMGSNKGQFRAAEVVACDPLGFILVGDAGNARIQVFGADGTLVRVIGGYGEAPGKFAWVSGLVVTPQLEIIATDYKNRRLQIL